MKRRLLLTICSQAGILLILMTPGWAADIPIGGATSAQSILKEMTVYYENLYPDVSLKVVATNNSSAIQALLSQSIDIGMLSRFLSPDEFTTAVQNNVYPSIYPIALDGVTLVVHKDNATESLSLEQIKDIFSGKISNWNSISNTDARIDVLISTPGSGTHAFFTSAILGDTPYVSTAVEQPQNQDIVQYVQSHPHAIGYVGLGYLSSDIKVVAIKGIYPTYQTISEGLYPLAHNLFIVTNGIPPLNSHRHRMIKMFYSFEGQRMIEKNGFIPLTDY